MSMSALFIIISLSGILAAIIYYLRQAKSKQEVSENPAVESDSIDSDNKAQQNALLTDTVILVIFFCLLLILGTQLS